jgi:hypothetical protein
VVCWVQSFFFFPRIDLQHQIDGGVGRVAGGSSLW